MTGREDPCELPERVQAPRSAGAGSAPWTSWMHTSRWIQKLNPALTAVSRSTQGPRASRPKRPAPRCAAVRSGSAPWRRDDRQGRARPRRPAPDPGHAGLRIADEVGAVPARLRATDAIIIGHDGHGLCRRARWSERDGARDDIPKLADVAGPVMVQQSGEHFARRDGFDAVPPQKARGELADVVATGRKRREVDLDHRQSTIEVAPKSPARHLLPQIPGLAATIRTSWREGRVSPSGVTSPFSIMGRSFLERTRQLSDVVEECRATSCRREGSGAVGVRAGIRTTHTLKRSPSTSVSDPAPQSKTTNGPRARATGTVNGARCQLLASSDLTGEQHGVSALARSS
jgi:hypothetical protein